MTPDVMSPDARLAYMADQIARNFATRGEDAAIRATADHIQSFWAVRMKARAFALLESGDVAFTPMARAALLLVRDGPVESQTPATIFNAVDEAGHSDAG